MGMKKVKCSKGNIVFTLTSLLLLFGSAFSVPMSGYAADQNFNQPYSLDESSMNDIDGFLSYTGWFRPKQIRFNGEAPQQDTSSSDWRPFLMYTWPNEEVQADYLTFFLENGFSSSDNDLTIQKVREALDLPIEARKKVLDNYAAIMRDNIEKNIHSEGNTGKLSNTINKFVAQNSILAPTSEQSMQDSKKMHFSPENSGIIDDDQMVFHSSELTPNTSSSYRLLNRTTKHQIVNGAKGNGVAPELLVGSDIDNSNPAVQAENLNWEYFLLNYGELTAGNEQANFDGFRIDAADNIDADVLDQVGQLVQNMYGSSETAKHSHLIYNEGYETGLAKEWLDSSGNSQLLMDAWYFYTLENVFGLDSSNSMKTLSTNSVVNRTKSIPENSATPNWSFVNNHDQQKNRINQIILDKYPNNSTVLGKGYTKEKEKEAISLFKEDMSAVEKKYAPMNIPSRYALLLSNKDTVPQVYYGDMYDEFGSYMQNKTIYYEAITKMLSARIKYATGDQWMMSQANDTLVASVRAGENSTSGMVVLTSNGKFSGSKSDSIYLGEKHKKQTYIRLIGTDSQKGLVYDEIEAQSDDNGNIILPVEQAEMPEIYGHLSIWVPKGAPINQNITKQPQEKLIPDIPNGKHYQSNSVMDSHVIYQTFSLYQPFGDLYKALGDQASDLKALGLTDIWMPPAYRSFSMARYMEGYAVADRYDLGDGEPTKYGSSDDLRESLIKLHKVGFKVQADLVLNQVFGLNQQEATMAERGDRWGRNYDDSDKLQYYLDKDISGPHLYFSYTKGGGPKQEEYGGAYLEILKDQYPALFNTRAKSTGENLPFDQPIKKWQAKYQNATSLQALGINLAVKVDEEYATIKDAEKKVPKELSAEFDPTLLIGKQQIVGVEYIFDEKGVLVEAVDSNIIPQDYDALIYQDNKTEPGKLYNDYKDLTKFDSIENYNGNTVHVSGKVTYGGKEYIQIKLNKQLYWTEVENVTVELASYQKNSEKALVHQIERSDGIYKDGPFGTNLTKTDENKNASTLVGQTVDVLATIETKEGQVWKKIKALSLTSAIWIKEEALQSMTGTSVTPYEVMVYQPGKPGFMYSSRLVLEGSLEMANENLYTVNEERDINGVKYLGVTSQHYWIKETDTIPYQTGSDFTQYGAEIQPKTTQLGMYLEGPFGSSTNEKIPNQLVKLYAGKNVTVIETPTMSFKGVSWVKVKFDGQTYWMEEDNLINPTAPYELEDTNHPFDSWTDSLQKGQSMGPVENTSTKMYSSGGISLIGQKPAMIGDNKGENVPIYQIDKPELSTDYNKETSAYVYYPQISNQEKINGLKLDQMIPDSNEGYGLVGGLVKNDDSGFYEFSINSNDESGHILTFDAAGNLLNTDTLAPGESQSLIGLTVTNEENTASKFLYSHALNDEEAKELAIEQYARQIFR